MRRLIYSIAILCLIPFASTTAQEGFSLGIGAGPNFYWGSIAEGKYTGFTGHFDGRYHFNNIFSTTLSYSYNHLQASRYNDAGLTEKYFSTKANNIDLHLGVDVFQLLPVITKNHPLKTLIDVGVGYSFFNEGLYCGEATPAADGQLEYRYKGTHGKGSSAKIHMGGEAAYSINDTYSVFTSILAHYYFTSDLDGYAHYLNQPEKPTRNDVYYSTTIGVRYALGESKTKRKTPSRSIFQAHKFSRYGNKIKNGGIPRSAPKQQFKRYSNKRKGGGIRR